MAPVDVQRRRGHGGFWSPCGYEKGLMKVALGIAVLSCWTPSCTDGYTKAITAEDTVRQNPVIRDGGVPSSPNPTLPATEQWVGELLCQRF